MADPTLSSHTLHVTGWDYRSQIELRCHSGPEAPCRYLMTEDGDTEQVDYCNAIEWWNEVDHDDLIVGALAGPPPWIVDVVWPSIDDGPEIRASDNAEDHA